MIWHRYSYLFFKIILINAHKTITTTTAPIKLLVVIIIIITSHYKLTTDAFNCISFSHVFRLDNSITYNLTKQMTNFFNNYSSRAFFSKKKIGSCMKIHDIFIMSSDCLIVLIYFIFFKKTIIIKEYLNISQTLNTIFF